MRDADAVELHIGFKLGEQRAFAGCAAGSHLDRPWRVPVQGGGNHIGTGFRRMEIRHARRGEPRQRVRSLGHEKRRDRLFGTGAIDDRLDREIGIEPRRGADHDHDQIEFWRRGENIERALHHIILRTGEREIDDPRRRHVQPGHGLDARQRLRRRRLDRNAACRERIDHHGRTARRGRDDGDGRTSGLAGDWTHARQQRESLDQALQRIDAGDAALGEEHAGEIILTRERAGVRHRKLARCGRTAELVGEHRLAAFGRLQRERAQRLCLPHGFKEQHVAVDAGVVECGGANLADRKIDLVADRDEAREMNAARLAARQERTDHAAGVRCREDAADRQTGFVERGVGGEKRLVPQVDHTEARRTDKPCAGILEKLPYPRLPRGAFRASLGKAVGERGYNRHPDSGALFNRFHGRVGGGDDIGVVRHLRQICERRPGALAQHLVAPRIDRIDAAGIAGLPEVF